MADDKEYNFSNQATTNYTLISPYLLQSMIVRVLRRRNVRLAYGLISFEIYNDCRILYRNTNNYICLPVYLCSYISHLSYKNTTINNLPTYIYINEQN